MGRFIDFQSESELKNFLIRKIKIDKEGLSFLLNKHKILFFYFENIPNQVCNIVKQELLSSGGDAAVSREVGRYKQGKSNILIFGTRKVLNNFIQKAELQTPTVKKIGKEIKNFLDNIKDEVPVYKVGNKIFKGNKNYILGILNITPDSFYDGGRYISAEEAVERAMLLQKQGADIIDIGAESTRPGADKISAAEEIKRLKPVLKALKNKIKIPISVDTYKSKVADMALSEGAEIINDISGLKFDKNMARVVAKHKASVIVMHIKGTPKNMQNNPVYNDLIEEIIDYLRESINIALNNNIDFERIMVDVGIGFGKTVEHNYILLNKLKEFTVLGRPVLVGLSRKSLIGKVLNNTPDARLTGSLVLDAVSILNGANFIRVHDVKEHKELIKLLEFLKTRGIYS